MDGHLSKKGKEMAGHCESYVLPREMGRRKVGKSDMLLNHLFYIIHSTYIYGQQGLVLPPQSYGHHVPLQSLVVVVGV